MTYSLTHDCLYKKAPTLLPVQKSQEVEWLNSLPHCTVAYTKKAKRVNNLLTPTLLPLQKSQEDEWITHSHTVAYTEDLRGWMTYSLLHHCLHKRAWRWNELLTPTMLPVQKSQEGEWLTHSHSQTLINFREQGAMLPDDFEFLKHFWSLKEIRKLSRDFISLSKRLIAYIYLPLQVAILWKKIGRWYLSPWESSQAI